MSGENILISLIRNDDRDAFNALCRDRYVSLVSYARLFLDQTSAEDVVQDVLLAVWQRRKKLDAKDDLQPYLMRAVHNRCLNVLEHSRRTKSYQEQCRDDIAAMLGEYVAPEYNPVMAKIYNAELGESLRKAIDLLPQRCAEVFRLSYLENMTAKQIAERLGLSVSTVENHIYIAVRRLRQVLATAEK